MTILSVPGTAKRRSEFDRIVAEYLASGRSPSFGIEADAYTVAMLIRDYLRHCKAYDGTGASSDYHSTKSAMTTLRDLYADADAAEIGPVAFKAIRQTLVDTGTVAKISLTQSDPD